MENNFNNIKLSHQGQYRFFLYSYFNWSEGYWSMVSIAAVVMADLSNTFAKMISRLLGTVVGASYAYLAVHFIAHPIFILVLLLVIGIFFLALYCKKRSQKNFRKPRKYVKANTFLAPDIMLKIVRASHGIFKKQIFS